MRERIVMRVASGLAWLAAVGCTAGFALPAAADASPHRPPQHHKHHKHHKARHLTAAQRRRLDREKTALKQATLTLDSSFIQRAQADGTVIPFTIRLRKPNEGGPGDDVVEFDWDTSVTPWPLAGTVPPASPSQSNLDGAISYEWDYGADTTGYSVLGTVETHIGGGISMTGTGFQLAAQDGATCTSLQSLDVSDMSLTSAEMRFGTVNPFNNKVSGTISLRTGIRTKATKCDGTSAEAVATTSGDNGDKPLPIAFDGTFTVKPSIAADGEVRLGVLHVDDTQLPQRTTFGQIYACTDPAAADGCAREAFPVRTKLVSLTADVLAGDVMPGPPPAP